MNRFQLCFSTIALSVASTAALAQPSLVDLSFNDPWIRGSAPGQSNGAGYLAIQNTADRPLALVSAQSDRAHRVELHTIVREGNVAKMQEVEQIEVPANGTVELKPGGFHIMFIGLTEPFVAGQSIPVQLNFEGEQTVQVDFTVKPPTYTGGTGHGTGHSHNH